MKSLFSFLGPKKDAAYFIDNGAELIAAGRPTEAEKALNKALELAEENKDYERAAQARLKLGSLAESQFSLAVAEAHYSKAFRHYQDEEVWITAADCLMRLAAICQRQHRLSEATQYYGHAHKYYSEESAAVEKIALASRHLGECCLESGSHAMAERHFLAAIEKISAIEKIDIEHPREVLAPLWRLVGSSRAGQGKNDQAEEAFKRSLSIFDDLGMQTPLESTGKKEIALDLCACLHEYARLLLSLDKKAEGEKLLERANALCSEVPGYLLEADLNDELAALKG